MAVRDDNLEAVRELRVALGENTPRLDEPVFMAAAQALASLTASPSPEQLLPYVFDDRVVGSVAAAIRSALDSHTTPRAAGIATAPTETEVAPRTRRPHA